MGNVDPTLLHGFDCHRVNDTCRMCARTVNFDRVTAKLPHQPFGNLASAGISGANNENAGHDVQCNIEETSLNVKRNKRDC